MWYDTLFQLDDGVIVTDDRHHILDVNKSYERFSGYKKELLIGKNAGYIKSGLTPSDVYRSLKTALMKKQAWRGILTNKRPDGHLWNSSVSITPFLVDNRLMYIGVCRDAQDLLSQNVLEAYESLFLLIAQLSEASDPELQKHLKRVSQVVKLICEKSDVSREKTLWIQTASLLHDIGKMNIPKELLFKPGPLTPQERSLMKTHTTVGHDLLLQLSNSMGRIYGYNEALIASIDVAHYHHERYDGRGYPQGLKGEEIPLSARVVAIADVIDALFSARPYKKPWNDNEVKQYLAQAAGKQFDPNLVSVVMNQWNEITAIYEAHSRQEV